MEGLCTTLDAVAYQSSDLSAIIEHRRNDKIHAAGSTRLRLYLYFSHEWAVGEYPTPYLSVAFCLSSARNQRTQVFSDSLKRRIPGQLFESRVDAPNDARGIRHEDRVMGLSYRVLQIAQRLRHSGRGVSAKDVAWWNSCFCHSSDFSSGVRCIQVAPSRNKCDFGRSAMFRFGSRSFEESGLPITSELGYRSLVIQCNWLILLR